MARTSLSTNARILIFAGIVIAAVAIAVGSYFLYLRYFPRPAAAAATAVSKAQTAFNANNLTKALTQTNDALTAEPGDVDALIGKSLVLSSQGNNLNQQSIYGPQAATLANEAIALDATSSEAYRALGYADEIQQNYADAHAAYQQAISLDPTNALALFDDAHAYDLQGDLTKAEAGYRASLAVSRYTWDAYSGLARIDIVKGDTAEAMTYLKIIYGAAPNIHLKAEAAYSLGTLSVGQKDLDSAQTYFKEATLLDPSYPSGWVGLGSLYYIRAIDASSTPALSAADHAKYMLDSISALDTAVNLNPNQSIGYIQLAEDLSLVGKKTEALTAIADAAAAVPNDITLTLQGKTALLSQISAIKIKIQARAGT